MIAERVVLFRIEHLKQREGGVALEAWAGEGGLISGDLSHIHVQHSTNFHREFISFNHFQL